MRSDKLREIEEKNHEFERLVQVQIQHKEQIKTYEAQQQEREETIAEKVLRLEEQNKKILELEKFKFVLDYKIKELK